MGWVENLLDKANESLKTATVNILSNTFSYLNGKVSEVGGLTSQTPESWNNTIFQFINQISENVIVPVAGVIISYVLIYELITMVMDKNNFHEFDTSLFIRYIFKASIAIYFVSHTAEIVEAIFELGGYVAQQATGFLTADSNLDLGTQLQTLLEAKGDDLTLIDTFGCFCMALVVWIAVMVMGIYIAIIMYGRFMEIYLYMSVAPIPFATLTNKEWGTIGTSYIKSILALAFQGFLIMVAIGIYSTLIQGLAATVSGSEFRDALFEIIIYTVILAVAIGKTGSMSKTLFGTH